MSQILIILACFVFGIAAVLIYGALAVSGQREEEDDE